MRAIFRHGVLAVLTVPALAWATCQQPMSLPSVEATAYCPPPIVELPPPHDAQFTGQWLPTVMAAGQTYPVSMHMRNTGDALWSHAAGFRLGASADDATWGVTRVPVTGTVARHQEAQFHFTVRAPATSGMHPFQWRMVQDGVTWFGATTPHTMITVHAGSIVASPNPCTIPVGASTCTSTVSWSSSAANAEVWVTHLDGSNPALMAAAQNGAVAAPWIPANGLRFHLKTGGSNGLALATADVRGEHAVPPKPRVALSRRFVYDAHQQLCKSIEPETGATVRGYDGAGNLAWSAAGLALTNAATCDTASPVVAARKVTRSWDARHRIRALRFPDARGDTEYAYTPDGLLATMATENGAGEVVTSSYAWNRRGLPIAELMTVGATAWQLEYGYSANGALASLVSPDGASMHLAPNALGQPTRVGHHATHVSYHPNGAVKGFSYGNGIAHTTTQNIRQLPNLRRDALGNLLLHADHHDYDPNGNVAAISDALPGHRSDRTMGYDALDRLSWVVSPMYGTSANYVYDGLDNIVHASIGGANALASVLPRRQLAADQHQERHLRQRRERRRHRLRRAGERQQQERRGVRVRLRQPVAQRGRAERQHVCL